MSPKLGAIFIWYVDCLALSEGLDPICVVTMGILSIVLKASWVTKAGESTRRETTLDFKSFIAVRRRKIYNKDSIIMICNVKVLIINTTNISTEMPKRKKHKTSRRLVKNQTLLSDHSTVKN